jgi:precorrin-6A synthase
VTRAVRLVGIGPGGVDQLTVEAVRALRSCDAFLVVDKEEEAATGDLVEVRQQILERHVGGSPRVVHVADPPRDRSGVATTASYEQAVESWHDARADAFGAAVAAAVPDGGTVGLLVWGDPAFYDSSIRVLDRIVASGADVTYDVVPGVGAISLLAARHRLVLNTVGSPVTVTTGRRLLGTVEAGADNIVVMLDGGLACAALPPEEWSLWWGANLGTPDEALVAGPLAAVLPDVERARTAARAARGWVMDTYLLRRR